VVPLDGSTVAEAIVPFILEIAGPLDLEVILLRVLPPVPDRTVQTAAPDIVETLEAQHADAEEYLAALAAELHARGVRARTQVRRGEPPAQILAVAGEADADLIAMSTHGRTGLRRVLFGSVAQAVLEEAKVPVLLIRHTAAEVARRAAQAGRRT
jgi:nucleotide-binding universal stress UspA family protein